MNARHLDDSLRIVCLAVSGSLAPLVLLMTDGQVDIEVGVAKGEVRCRNVVSLNRPLQPMVATICLQISLQAITR